MTALGAGYNPTPPSMQDLRLVVADGSSEAVTEFCTQALAVLQQMSSVASSLGGAAGALAAAAQEVANQSRVQTSQSTQIIQVLANVTRALDNCANEMMNMGDMPTPQVTVNAESAAPAVTVLPAQVTTKKLSNITRDSDGRLTGATITET